VLAPRDIDEDLKLILRREIKEPPGRHVINAQHVCSQIAHLDEITLRLFPRAEGFAGCVGFERALRYAFDVELLNAETKEFAIHGSRVAGKQ